MSIKYCLTNEEIKEKFSSDFELVNYAIRLAKSMIHSGKEVEIDEDDVRNMAYQILDMILDGRDELDVDTDVVADHTSEAIKASILRRVEGTRKNMALSESNFAAE